MMRYTHRKLRKNWKILTHHARNGERLLSYKTLHEEGFLPNVLTGIIHEPTRVIYKCYEHLYSLDKDGIIELIGVDVNRDKTDF